MLEYAVKLARLTRPGNPDLDPELAKWINWGAGPPRQPKYLVLGAKARAALDGRLTPSEEDVKAVALPVASPQGADLLCRRERGHDLRRHHPATAEMMQETPACRVYTLSNPRGCLTSTKE